MNLRERIIQVMRETGEIQGKRIEKALNGGVILLDTGPDSLGFAILVARPEEELGYDPFVLMLKREGIVMSMDGRRRAFDNIVVEQHWRNVKHEYVYLKGYA